MDGDSLGLAVFAIVYLAFIVFFFICYWKIFKKAGRHGWELLIPIWNIIVMYKIAKMSPWLILCSFIPLVNIVISILFSINLANAFGKGGGFACGLIFLPYIFIPILALGDAEYEFDEDYY